MMLGIRTGNLYRSFGRNYQSSLTKIKVNKQDIIIDIGSKEPYANIQNVGGFIKSKGKMHKWFWYQYKKSNNDFYKIMALSVIKKGGVKIKATHYFDNAIKYLVEKQLNDVLNNFIIRIINASNNNLEIALKQAITILKEVSQEVPELFQIAFSEVTDFRDKNNKFMSNKTMTWVS